MKEFFKFTLATVVGIIISSIFLFIFSAIIIGGIISSVGKEKMVELEENTILKISLSEEISERGSDNPMENINFQTLAVSNKLGLKDILDNIRKAKTDPNIKGIYLELTNIPCGISTLSEIREALLDFKKSKKFMICYSDSYTQKTYFLATVADKIYLNPEGEVSFLGLNAQVMFYKKMLEKIGVQPEVIRHGKFKSAIEPFILEKMSKENRDQMSTFVNAIWNEILKGISDQRKISIEELNKIADNADMTLADDAVKNKFVDSLKYKDQILAELKKLSGIGKKDDLKFIELSKYKKVASKSDEGVIKDKIAIIYANGEIGMGEGDEKSIGSDGLSAAIRKARGDSAVKVIVLRVNSPGGSALASEIIWREVILAKKDKPVIVSMGDLAASGGYYIACAANKIVANPTTLTGSIGVF